MKKRKKKVTKKYQNIREDSEKQYADHAEIIVELESNLDATVAALKALVNRLHEIHADEHYKSVWTSYMIHGGDYSDGPKYDKELAVADAVLYRVYDESA